MLRALRSLDEKDGDVLVFESAGGTSQFRRFVAAKSSWNEVGRGGSLSHDGDVVICCGCSFRIMSIGFNWCPDFAAAFVGNLSA